MKRYAFTAIALMMLFSLMVSSQSAFSANNHVQSQSCSTFTHSVGSCPQGCTITEIIAAPAGQTATVTVIMGFPDPGNPPAVLILSSPGLGQRQISGPGTTTTFSFTLEQDNEVLTIFRQNFSARESYSVTICVDEDCEVVFDGATNFNVLDSGFDKTDPNAPWLSVAINQTTEVARALISPRTNVVDVRFRSANTSIALVSPAQPSSRTQPLRVTGTTPGETQIEARLRDQNPVCSALNVVVFPKRRVRVAVHIITPVWQRNQPLNGCPIPRPNTTQQALNNVLNNIWDQAAVDFDVMPFEEKQVDFDLNGDCRLNILESDQSEVVALLNGAANPQADINIFYVYDLAIEGADFAGGTIESLRVSFIQNEHSDTTEHLTAHEIGHSLGLDDVYNDKTRLMFGSPLATNPYFLNKPEWVTANTRASMLSHQISQGIVQNNTATFDRIKAQAILSEIEQGSSIKARTNEFLAIGNELVPLLLERLKNKQPNIRKNALDLLGQIDLRDDSILNQEQIIDALVKAIDGSEPSRDVAHTSLRHLQNINPNRATPAMKQALLLQLQKGQPLAARILGQVGDASFRPALEPYLSSNDKALSELTKQALAKLGDQRHLSEIVAELDSENVNVRLEAFKKLAYIGDRATVRKIAQYLWIMDTPPRAGCVIYMPYCFSAADALSKIVDNPPVKSTPSGICTNEEIQVWKAWWQSHQHEYP